MPGSNDRSQAQRIPAELIEPVQACADDGLNRIRQNEMFRSLAQYGFTVFNFNHSFFQQGIADLFRENFKTYEDGVSAEVLAAGPKGN